MAAAILGAAGPRAAHAARPGAAVEIVNTATVSYGIGTLSLSHPTNTVLLSTTFRTPSTIEFLRYAPGHPRAEQVPVVPGQYSTSGSIDGPFSALGPPMTLAGQLLGLDAPLPLVLAHYYRGGEPVFIRLTDLDQNVDPEAVEQVVVTIRVTDLGDTEVLLLTETGPDTGVFAGYVQSAAGSRVEPANGFLSVVNNSQIVVSYFDQLDGADLSVSAALTDPIGIVFDSQTGVPINGAVVTIVNEATGMPAVVFGADGVSAYPATLESGSRFADHSGQVYDLPAGGFRFPGVPPGRYRIEVVPPGDYGFPSAESDAAIAQRTGNRYTLALGSRGEVFTVDADIPPHIDIPLDPDSHAKPNQDYLWLVKTAGKAVVETGGYMSYLLHLENRHTVRLTGVVVTDVLPPGFRYQAGSATRDRVRMDDPAVAADGRTLEFVLGTIEPGAGADVRYTVWVTPAARPGDAVNRARATFNGSAVSREALARVTVRDELFGKTGVLAGRVAAVDAETDSVAGVAGVRVYLEDGTYTVTDEHGRYHFEGVRPGAHVVQLDLESVPPGYDLLRARPHTRFAGRAHSQFVELQPGMLWRTDFQLAVRPPPSGSAALELSSVLVDAAAAPPPGAVEYALRLSGRTVAVGNLRPTVILPEGAAYRPGSSRLDGAPLADPEGSGTVLTWRLGDPAAVRGALPDSLAWAHTLTFTAALDSGAAGELVARALLTFAAPDGTTGRTAAVQNALRRDVEPPQVEEASVTLHLHFDTFSAVVADRDRPLLDQIAAAYAGRTIEWIRTVGHTDSIRIAPRSRHIFADNYALSQARARSVATYMAEALGVPLAQVTAIGRGQDEPIADNRTPEGRARNRRVELTIAARSATAGRSTLVQVQDRDSTRVAVQGLRPGQAPPAPEAPAPPPDLASRFGKAFVEQTEPGLAILWPPDGHNPELPSVALVVRYDPRRILNVWLDGTPVSALNLDGIVRNDAGTVAVGRWAGVDIEEGWNTFVAVETDSSGAQLGRVVQAVHLSGEPVRFALDEERSVLVADGRTPPRIAVRMLDKDGHPARKGIVGEYDVQAPYVPAQLVQNLQRRVLAGPGAQRVSYAVADDGVAYIELQPTARSGEVVVSFPLRNNSREEIRAWLKPGVRDWILVGLADNTTGYQVVSQHLEPLPDDAPWEEYHSDGRVAFFAKGRVRGDWLMSVAYDSDRPKDEATRTLFSAIDPDAYFMVYGDGSQQSYEAPSGSKLFVRLERDQVNLLWGYYHTDLTVTELSRYSRTLNGLKGERQGRRTTLRAFASETSQAFVKDELRGDGTSGLYALSRRDLFANSETVTIEVRDRYRSEVILSQRRLIRHVDYDIDYQAATLFFREPVPAIDPSFNPVYIVVEYEAADAGTRHWTYGGRGAVRLLDRTVEAGATYVHEETARDAEDLAGVDVRVRLGAANELRAEYADTRGDSAGSRSAWQTELIRRTGQLDGRLYVREQEQGFGLGQQRATEDGTRKIGLDASLRLGRDFALSQVVFRQRHLATDARRDLADTRLNYTRKRYTANLGYRHADDRLATGGQQASDLLAGGGSVGLLDNRLQLRATHEQALGERDDSADFPSRSLAGADLYVTERTRLFAEHEFARGEDFDAHTSRAGVAARPWQGAETSTSLQRSYAENGQRLAAMLGLKQSLKLTERLMVDAGLDRVQSLRNRPAARPLPAAADPYPATDYTAVSTGAAYQFEGFTWTSRAELRRADDQDKWGITSGAYGEPRPGLGLSAAVRMLASDARRGQQTTDAALRFGLVWRPDESRWMVLNRADYIAGDQQGGLFVADNRRLVNNLKAHWQIGARQELAVTWGAKYVIETIDGREYSGLVNMAAVEHRYDVTPRWDVGVHSSLLHAAENGSLRYGAGASLGYQVADNVWLSAGYQVAGYEDADFSRFEYTAHGPFVRFRIKLDQESAPRAAGMLLGLFSPAGEPGRVAANGPAAPRAPHTPARPGEQRPTAK